MYILYLMSAILRRIHSILFKRQPSGLPLPPPRNLLLSYGGIAREREFPFQVSAMPVASAFDRQAIELRSRDPAR